MGTSKGVSARFVEKRKSTDITLTTQNHMTLYGYVLNTIGMFMLVKLRYNHSQAPREEARVVLYRRLNQ